MAINFNSDTTPTEVTAAQGQSINLTKDTFLDLTKQAPGLTNVVFAAGWDTMTTGRDADLDTSLFLCGSNGKIISNSHIIFFNNKVAPGIRHNGDNLTGAGDGDDETININLSEVDSNIHSIVAVINIFEAESRMQTFGMVENAYVRLLDAQNGSEIARYDLKGDYSTSTGVVVAELTRSDNGWVFHAIGEGKRAELGDLINLYR